MLQTWELQDYTSTSSGAIWTYMFSWNVSSHTPFLQFSTLYLHWFAREIWWYFYLEIVVSVTGVSPRVRPVPATQDQHVRTDTTLRYVRVEQFRALVIRVLSHFEERPDLWLQGVKHDEMRRQVLYPSPVFILPLQPHVGIREEMVRFIYVVWNTLQIWLAG